MPLRRVIRKRPRRAPRSFDEQLWPVNLAIAVLGGFSIGVAAAFLDFDEPRPLYNAWTSIAAITAITVGVMVSMRWVDNRVMRRGMQLAIVLACLLHLMFVVSARQIALFGRVWTEEVAQEDLTRRRSPVVVQDFIRLPDASEETPDYERPIEVETPEVPPEEVERQERTDIKPPEPTAVAETQPTTEPQPIERVQPQESAPRASPSLSKLSRRQTDRQLDAALPSPTPSSNPVKTSSPQSEPQPTEIARTASANVASRAETSPSPTQPQQAVTRRDASEQQPQSSTPQSRPRQSKAAPQVASAATPAEPAPARATTESAQPSPTTIARRETDRSPKPERNTDASEPSQTAAREIERRRVDSPRQPQMAASPQPTANRRPRVTTRPDAALASDADSPQPNEDSPTATPQVQPQSTRLATQTARSADSPLRRVEPDASRLESSPTPVRRAADTTTPAVAAAATTPRRREAQLSPAPSVTAATPTAVARESNRGEVSPQSMAVTKQATTNQQAAPEQSAELAATTGSRANPRASRSRAARREREPSPVAESASQVARSQPRAVRNAETATSTMADAPTDLAVNQAAETRLQPATTQVTQQAASATAAATGGVTGTTAEAPSPTGTTPTTTRRSQSSSSPQVAAAAIPSQAANRPTRSMEVAATTAPQLLGSPAAGRADARPSAEPSAIALTRGQAGIAGAGGSPNMDRSSPAADTPSQVASASASRREASQDAPQGPALSPQAAALTRNSRAMSDRSAALSRPQAVAVSNTSASEHVAGVAASSSAALETALSNANPGETTADAGATEVDLGPTRVVSEAGAARARSAGGGQPEVSAIGEAQARPRRTLGSPDLVVATENGGPAAEVASASSGEPAEAAMAADVALAERSENAAPASPDATGPRPAGAPEPGQAPDAGTPQLARAELGSELAEPAAESGDEDDEEDEEKKRAQRLARRFEGGAPQLALAGSRVAETPAAAETVAGNSTSPLALAAQPSAGEVARMQVDAAPAEAATDAEPGGDARASLIGSAQSARAEVADGDVGAPTIGGGSPQLARRSAAASFDAANVAETIEVRGELASSGTPTGSSLAAASAGIGRRSAPATLGEAGPAVASAAEPQTNAGGGAAGTRAESQSSGQPQVAGQTGARSVARAKPSIAPNAAVAGVIATPSPGDIPVSVVTSPSPRVGDSVSSVSRQAAGSIAVAAAAPEGPGGLGSITDLSPGLSSRRAQSDSMQVHTRPTRFIRKDAGGRLSLTPSVIVAAEAFQGRNPAGRASALGPQTEKAVELGLAFLARHQRDDGSWSLKGFPESAQMDSPTAATGLALLAFQGAGYHHRDYEYKANCAAALEYLLSVQKENGDLYIPFDEFSNSAAWMYSHGIAALALTEAYGMTQDPKLKEPAQKALDFIVAAQDPNSGGWRYAPQMPGDTSVTGWMMMALKSGELAGLNVPEGTYVKIDKWLKNAAAGENQERFRYNPDAPDTPTQRHGRDPTYAMTAVGLLMRFYAGWNRDSESMKRGAIYLLDRLPGEDDESAYDARRDTYYWYYATQVLFHMKGDYWEKWNGTLRPMLLESQIQQGAMAGSWDPMRPVPDRWGAQAGRLFVTTLNLLSLEVRFRHMPLNEFTGR